MDFSGFGGGWQDNQEFMDRNRRELAQAFERFKQNNPYADASDFQSFIDQASGGSNYIRGGAPSKDILDKLSNDNQETKAHDKAMRDMKRLTDRNRLVESYRTLARDSAYGGDLSGLSGRQQTFNANNADAIKLLGPDWDKDIWTEGAYNTQAWNKKMDKMPRALQWMKSVAPDGELTADQRAQFQSALGLSAWEVDGMLDETKDQWQQGQTEYHSRMRDTLTAQMVNYISSGSGTADDWISAHNSQRGNIQIVGDVAKQYKNRAEAEVSQRNNELTDEAMTSFNNVTSNVRGDTNIEGALTNQNMLEAGNMLLSRYKDLMSPRHFKSIFGDGAVDGGHEKIQSVLQIEMENLKALQAQTYQNKSDQINEKALSTGTERVRAIQEDFVKTFESGTPNQAGAAQFLAAEFNMAGTAKMIAMKIIGENPNKDVAEIIQAVKTDKDFASVANSISDARNNIERGVKESLGTFRIEPIETFLSENENDIAEINSMTALMITQVGTIQDPNERLAVLQERQNALMTVAEEHENEFRNRSNNRRAWREFGTEPWDDAKILPRKEKMDNQLKETAALIQAEIDLAQDAIRQANEDATKNNGGERSMWNKLNFLDEGVLYD
jgi:hypothetical protein